MHPHALFRRELCYPMTFSPSPIHLHRDREVQPRRDLFEKMSLCLCYILYGILDSYTGDQRIYIANNHFWEQKFSGAMLSRIAGNGTREPLHG